MSTASGGREGQTLGGKYRLTRLLGSGGMGDVYEAENVLIGRRVAIKLLHDQHARDPDISRRFLSEAHTASMVRHKNVVDVLDLGSDERGTPFIVQEFLEGEDLRARLEKVGARLSADQAVPLLMPIVEAVAHAHSKGVVHRDLKPANIFLARESGRTVPKLLDFGISRVVGVRMTATGASMGTPAYMSPELVQGARDVDGGCDVWALGVILFEMITGTMPFDADSPGAVFVKICTTDAPPLESIEPRVSANLARVVNRCLRRGRSERYKDGAELARDLHHVLSGRALETRVGTPELPRPDRNLAMAETQAAHDVPPLDVPKLDMPTLDKKALATIAAPSSRTHALQEIEALKLASIPPPPSRAAMASLPHVPPPALLPSSPLDFPHPLPLGLSLLGVLIGATVLCALNPIEGGWPVVAFATSLLADSAHVVTMAVGLLLAGSAVFMLVRGIRSAPIAAGFIVSAAGLLSLACTALVVLSSEGGPLHVPMLLGLGAALAPFGFAVGAVQDLVRGWLRHDADKRFVYVAIAAVALCAGIEMTRAADAEPHVTTVQGAP